MDVNELVFSYGKRPVLNGVTFSLKKKECLLLVGQNGSGKTTLLSCLLGMLKPQGGSVVWNSSNECLNGFISEPRFFLEKNGLFQIEYENELRRGGGKIDNRMSYGKKKLVDEVEKACGMIMFQYSDLYKKVGKYSTGMKKKLALIKSLVFNPGLLILDEPTNGLDPNGIIELRDSLIKVRDELDTTIILSSHQLSESSKCANRAIILSDGKIINSIEIMAKKKEWKITLLSRLSDEEMTWLGGMFRIKLLKEVNGFVLQDQEEENIPSIIRSMINRDMRICGVSKNDNDIEDAYLEAIRLNDK